MQKLIAGAVCAAALLSAGAAAAQATPQSYRYNWTPAGTLTPAPSPMDFLMLAGGGDLYEIQSSQAVLETTQNPEVRRFAQMMIDHHTQTTATVTAAAREAGMTPPPPALDTAKSQMIRELQRELYDEGGYIVWGFANQIDAYHNYVVGLGPHPGGMPLGQAMFEKVWIAEV